MKPKTYILPCAAAVALLFTSCEKPAKTNGNATPPAEGTAIIPDDAYPLKTCPVSGEELGSMGDPIIAEHEGTTVKLCCKSCIKDFNADPEKYTAIVKGASKQ